MFSENGVLMQNQANTDTHKALLSTKSVCGNYGAIKSRERLWLWQNNGLITGKVTKTLKHLDCGYN